MASKPPHQTSDQSNAEFFRGAAAILALIFLAYFPALRGGFVWDDDILLTNNPLVKSAGGLSDIWSSTQQPDYFPLTSTVFWLQWRLWGMEPAGYHVINLLLHGIGTILLWRLLRRLKIQGAWVAAAIFALHPVCVASVAWIAELKNTLSFVFFMLSLLWFVGADEQDDCEGNKRPGTHSYWLSLGAFLFALLSKTSVVTLPFVLLAYAWWRRSKITRRDLWRTAPYFSLSFIMGLITLWFQSARIGNTEVIEAGSLANRIAIAGKALCFYIWKAFWPTNLSAIYRNWPIDSVSLLMFAWWIPVFLALAVLWKFRHTWGRHGLFIAVYFVAMLLPVLGFFKMSYFMHARVADHWQYLAIIGIIAGVVSCVHRLLIRSTKSSVVLPCAAVITITATGALSWQQAGTYTDIETLWRDTLKKNPTSWGAHLGLGKILAERNETTAAIASYTEALRLQPKAAEIHYNLGNSFLAANNLPEAISAYERAFQLRPRYPEAHYNLGMTFEQQGNATKALEEYLAAIAINPQHANAHNNAGNILAQSGRLDEAIAHYVKALSINPGLPETHNNLANIFNHKGNLNEAIGHYEKALALKPAYPDANHNLAVALEKAGRPDEASARLREAIRLKPDYADAHFALANILFAQKNFTEAEIHYRQAVQLKPSLFEAHYNLAMTLLAQNRKSDAITHLQESIRINPEFQPAKEELAKLSAP